MVIPEDLYKQIYDAGTDSFDDQFVSNVITKYEQDGYFAVLPLSSKGEKFRWRWGYKSCVAGVKSGMLFCKAVRGGGYAVYQYDFADEEATPKSLWFGENMMRLPRAPICWKTSFPTIPLISRKAYILSKTILSLVPAEQI